MLTVPTSVADMHPDPNWIRFQKHCGFGSGSKLLNFVVTGYGSKLGQNSESGSRFNEFGSATLVPTVPVEVFMTMTR